MRNFFTVLSVATLTACTTATPPEPPKDWPAIAYAGFIEKIDRLAGSGAVNCGLIDQVKGGSKAEIKSQIRTAQKCVDVSISSGTPFKVGSFRIASTSYLYEVATRSSTGEYWVVLFDRAMDGSENMHFVKRCKSLQANLWNGEYSGDCTDVPTDVWLADIIGSQ